MGIRFDGSTGPGPAIRGSAWRPGPAGRNDVAGRRRSELELAVAILRAINEEASSRRCEPPRTRIQSMVYLNWAVFHEHLERLRDQGLISADALRVTDRGHEFLHAYQAHVEGVIERFGFGTGWTKGRDR